MRCDSRHPNRRPLHTLPPELRRTTVPPAVREWIRAETGSDVVRWRRLSGASTTAVHRIGLGDGRSLVLRQYVWRALRESEPELPGREVDALRFAARHGLAVPEVVAADTVDEVPLVLMTFVPGKAVGAPPVEALAEVAAQIHAVDAADLGHEYFPWYLDLTDPPADTARPQLWEKAIEVWHDDMPEYAPALIHRDFHPGNVLWSRGRLGGIVDWPNGCRGPVGCDVAHCRTNLIDWASPEAADAFQRAYERLTGIDHHPYWELAAVLESQRTRGAEARLERALAELLG